MRRRISELGVNVGTKITVLGVAPMGDPMEFSVQDYRLSLRKDEASLIRVEVTSDEITTLAFLGARKPGSYSAAVMRQNRLPPPHRARSALRTKVGVIKNDNSGPLILSLGGGRLALGGNVHENLG